MDSQKWTVRGENVNVTSLRFLKNRQDSLLFIAVFLAALIVAPLLIVVGLKGSFGTTLGLTVVLVVALLVIYRPKIGLFLVVICTVLIEQEPLSIHILTDRLYVYYWPPSLAGLADRPIGFLFLLTLFALMCHRFVKRERVLFGGELLWPFLCFLGCVGFEVVNGLATGGDFKTIILEVRPFWYLFITYLLAYNLFDRKSEVRLFFWLVVIGAGIKGLQGSYIYFIALHRNLTGQNEIMAHEESFFFAALILLVLIFLMHEKYRPQLYTALAVLFFVFVAMGANDRRTDYVALLVGLLVTWMLVYQVKKEARRSLVTGLILVLVLGGAYVAIFSHLSGPLASPARSIISIVHPTDSRDANSNLYRTIEDFDLKFTARQSFPLGFGFGKEFLQPQVLPNILSEDPVYLLIPHNTIYWVWMRLGAIGFAMFWYIIGSVIVRGCLIVRQLQNRYLRTAAIYIVSVIFMEIVVAYADYQLYAFRNVIYLGLLIGLLLRLPALDAKEALEEQERNATSQKPARVKALAPLDLLETQAWK